jgi:hypothetical protein
VRYAQEKGGQQLHLVEEVDLDIYGDTVKHTALCGKRADSGWRMTINMPLGHACKNCLRVLEARRRA